MNIIIFLLKIWGQNFDFLFILIITFKNQTINFNLFIIILNHIQKFPINILIIINLPSHYLNLIMSIILINTIIIHLLDFLLKIKKLFLFLFILFNDWTFLKINQLTILGFNFKNLIQKWQNHLMIMDLIIMINYQIIYLSQRNFHLKCHFIK